MRSVRAARSAILSRVASTDRIAVLNLTVEDWSTLSAVVSASSRKQFDVNVRQAPVTNATARVTLIMVKGHLRALGLLRSLGSSGDLDTKVRARYVSIVEPVRLQPLLDALPPQMRSRAADVLSTNDAFTEAASERVREWLSRRSPELGAILDNLASRRQPAEDGSAARQAQQEQRDALALALEAAGIDSEAMVPQVPQDLDGSTPFLAGLAEASTSEASIIRSDFRSFGDWQLAESDVHDVVHFVDATDSRRRMTVVYADKENLEVTTGTDLVYYRYDDPAFLLVQYKRMQMDPGLPAAEAWGWRVNPADAQLQAELLRMQALRGASQPTSVADWRLTAEPFFFKLVEGSKMRSRDERLARGMYFPLDLLEMLLHDPTARGPRGGVRLGWHNAQRYLTTTQFLNLLQSGFIGSRGAETQKLSAFVQATLERGRGVLLARDETVAHVRRQQRRRRRAPS